MKWRRQSDQWFEPDTSKTFDLGVIADRAEVSLDTSTKRENQKDALVEIHFRQAVPRDDPDNPNYALIEMLKRMRAEEKLTPAAIDYEIAKLERRLFPDLDSIPFTAVVMRLREANAFLRSEKPEDQEKARKIIADVVRLTE